MTVYGERDSSLTHAEKRAMNISARVETRPVIGTAISELMKHGGVYTLADAEMMQRRMAPLVAMQVAHAGAALIRIRRDSPDGKETAEQGGIVAQAKTDAASMMRKAVEGAASVPTSISTIS